MGKRPRTSEGFCADGGGVELVAVIVFLTQMLDVTFETSTYRVEKMFANSLCSMFLLIAEMYDLSRRSINHNLQSLSNFSGLSGGSLSPSMLCPHLLPKSVYVWGLILVTNTVAGICCY